MEAEFCKSPDLAGGRWTTAERPDWRDLRAVDVRYWSRLSLAASSFSSAPLNQSPLRQTDQFDFSRDVALPRANGCHDARERRRTKNVDVHAIAWPVSLIGGQMLERVVKEKKLAHTHAR